MMTPGESDSRPLAEDLPSTNYRSSEDRISHARDRSDSLRKDQVRAAPLWAARLFENCRRASRSTFGERNPAYRAKRCGYTESTSRPSRCSSRHAELLVSATMLLSKSPTL